MSINETVPRSATNLYSENKQESSVMFYLKLCFFFLLYFTGQCTKPGPYLFVRKVKLVDYDGIDVIVGQQII